MKNNYVVRIDTVSGTEEYAAGKTLTQAREEAAFFVEHGARNVRICALRTDGSGELRPYLVEVAA